jgi:hypothetical protein
MSTWVISPVLLNRANGGETSTLTINYRLATSFTGTVYFSFPSEFAVTSANTGASASFTAGTDLYFSVSVGALPTTSKGYGPISIWSRNSLNSQIIDITQNFASVFVTP